MKDVSHDDGHYIGTPLGLEYVNILSWHVVTMLLAISIMADWHNLILTLIC